MRTGIAVVVATGVFWSVAVMSKWVPVAGAEMRSAAVIQPYGSRRAHRAPTATAQEAMRVAVGATGDAKRRSPGGPLSVALADFRHAGENL